MHLVGFIIRMIMWGIQSSQSEVRMPSFVFNSLFHSCLFNHPVINLLYVLLIDLVMLLIALLTFHIYPWLRV
jgi:hypothetical protein